MEGYSPLRPLAFGISIVGESFFDEPGTGIVEPDSLENSVETTLKTGGFPLRQLESTTLASPHANRR